MLCQLWHREHKAVILKRRDRQHFNSEYFVVETVHDDLENAIYKSKTWHLDYEEADPKWTVQGDDEDDENSDDHKNVIRNFIMNQVGIAAPSPEPRNDSILIRKYRHNFFCTV